MQGSADSERVPRAVGVPPAPGRVHAMISRNGRERIGHSDLGRSWLEYERVRFVQAAPACLCLVDRRSSDPADFARRRRAPEFDELPIRCVAKHEVMFVHLQMIAYLTVVVDPLRGASTHRVASACAANSACGRTPNSMRRLLVIGMGAGDPAFVTVQAVDAINAVDVFFVIDKGEAKEDLVAVRQDVLNRYATPRGYRVVEIDDPQRDPGLPYEDAVARWHHERVLRFEQVLSNEVADGECAGILVWGDPSLYDSTLRVIDQVLAR